MNEQRVEFDGGAKRCDKKAPHFLVPIELMEAVAWTRFEGDGKYEPGNWQLGDPEFFVDCLSHAIQHLMEFPWDASEDHLGHAACNIGFILWAMKRGIVTREDFIRVSRIVKVNNDGRAPAAHSSGAPARTGRTEERECLSSCGAALG
jgi:hypothetical protein